MNRPVKISGEGIDADWVEVREFQYPSYPECPSCENETSNAEGWCLDCKAFVHEHPPQVSLAEWAVKHPQLVEQFEQRSLGNGWHRFAA